MEIRTTYTVKGSKGQDKTFPTKTEAEAYLANEDLVNCAAESLKQYFKKKNLHETGLTFWSPDCFARFIAENADHLVGICEFWISDYDKKRLAHNYEEYLEKEWER